MPWHVEKRGDKHVVVANEGGKVMGTHDTKPEADAQVKALYASMPEAAEHPMSARDHDRKMRAGGPTGMMKKGTHKPSKRGSMNPPFEYGGDEE